MTSAVPACVIALCRHKQPRKPSSNKQRFALEGRPSPGSAFSFGHF